jgi:hypothetical protein
MFDCDPIIRWVKTRIVFLGDAAHLPLQYMAQGHAIEYSSGTGFLGVGVLALDQRRPACGGLSWRGLR